MINHIIVVCVGNICRSPMAEALLKQALHGSDVTGIRVDSAGVQALVGHLPSEAAQRVMRDRRIDVSAHRAHQLTDEAISAADLILTMETEQKKWIEARIPAACGKVYRLGHWSNFEVPDPIGQSDEIFENVLLLIDRGIFDWISKLKR